MPNLINEGVNLMFVGMGLVFLFLALLVLLVKIMTLAVARFAPEEEVVPVAAGATGSGQNDSLISVINEAPVPAAPSGGGGEVITSPMAGNIFSVMVSAGQTVAEGDVVIILEAMKMETEVRARSGGTVSSIAVKEGDAVAVGQVLINLS